MRALYDFAPTESGELAFSKGDIIRVLDSVYEHWWRGELRGNAGIFPVNYVVSPVRFLKSRRKQWRAHVFAPYVCRRFCLTLHLLIFSVKLNWKHDSLLNPAVLTISSRS